MPFKQLERRSFIALLGGAAAAWPSTARAQQAGRQRRIGVLLGLAESDPEGQARLGAFLQTLQQLDWIDGRNIQILRRYTEGDADRARAYAAELVALAPDVVLTSGASTFGLMLQATRTVPIVFAGVADPVGAGFVDSLARPGGNATGFTSYEYSMSGKWLDLLKEIAPGVKRVAVLRDPAVSAGTGQFGAIQTAAPSFGVELSPINVHDAVAIERAVTAFAHSGNGGLIVTTSAPSGSPAAAWPRTGLTTSTSTAAPPATSIASLRARSPRTCRWRHRQSTSWQSTSRPRRRSALLCHRPCSPAPPM
jgi:putative ABC transport system substrate-binding protein